MRLAIILAALCLVAVSESDAATSIDVAAVTALENDVQLLEPQLTYLTTEYVKRDLYDRPSIERRISDGEILHLLGDHARASIILYDVITREEIKGHPQYEDVLFYLAESEFQVRNYFGARHYFRQLITSGTLAHSFEAFGRLIEIADQLGDYTGVEEKVAELRATGAGKIRPDIAYFYGKSLARRKKSELAIAQLSVIDSAHRFYFRAQYIMAVELVRLGRLSEALPLFLRVKEAAAPMGLGATEKEQNQLHDLATLAVARVQNELQQLSEALDSYQDISRTSPYFEDMLYEVAWAYIRASGLQTVESERRSHLQKAVQALDLILLDEKSRVLLPQSLVLKGNVLLRLERHSEATAAFTQVSSVYGAAATELDDTLAQNEDAIAYFNRLIAKNQGVFSAAAFLPPIAVGFAEAERDVERALGISNDLDSSRVAIDEARQISEGLIAAMTTKRAVEYYPRLQEGELKSIEIESDVIQQLEKITQLVSQALRAELNESEQTKLLELANERRRLFADYRALPKSGVALKARKEQYESGFSQADKKAFTVRYEIEGARAQLVAVSKWVDDMASQKKLKKSDVKLLRQQIDTELRVIEELEREVVQLKRDTERSRSELSVSGDPDGREANLRANYVAAVKREMVELNKLSSRLGPTQQALAQRVLALRDTLDGYLGRLQSFRKIVDDVVTKKANEVAEAVRAEQERLVEYDRELASFGVDAKDLIGNVAYKTFESVRARFHDLVLRADVGDIDVAWRRKEERTEQINRLVKDQKVAQQQLDADFREVLSDGGAP